MKPSGRSIAIFLFILILFAGIFLNTTRETISFLEKSYFQSVRELFSKNPEPKVRNYLKPFAFAPEIVKAVYVTSWSASKEDYIDYLFDLISATEINAVVIDIKDFSGHVSYDAKSPEVNEYGAVQARISDIDSLVRKLHEGGIYVIGRISVFQDPILADSRPDLAVLSRPQDSTSSFALWTDNSGLSWIDPAARESWEYNASIAKDALTHGFDELNFDYVRFPSDGDLQNMVFPFWDGIKPRHLVIREFFQYLRQELPDARISIDLFGLSTISSDDLGVGQVIEDGYEYFDYVCPMVYPSHYATGFSGYPEPSEYPYEVVRKSMENAFRRLRDYNQAYGKNSRLRPWLQDFSLSVAYDAEMVKAEIRAAEDAVGSDFKGFMLWNSQNFYTKEALQPAGLE